MEIGYIAFDKTVFYVKSECETYEAKHAHLRLAHLLGVPFEKIAPAFDGTEEAAPTNSVLADCLEQVGAKLARERRARGDEFLKRKRAPKGAAYIEFVLRDGHTIEDLRIVLKEFGGDENSNLDVKKAHGQLELRKMKAAGTSHPSSSETTVLPPSAISTGGDRVNPEDEQVEL